MKWTGSLATLTSQIIPDSGVYLVVSEPYMIGEDQSYSPLLHVVDVVYKGETRPVAIRSLVRVP
jgi:hypothetical protein